MTKQLTFQRGNYTGNWVADEATIIGHVIADKFGPDAQRSGSLQILFKGEREIILYGKTEQAAENVFSDYVTPDHRHLAEEAFEDHHKNDIPFTYSLKQIGEDDRHIQHDVNAVREIIESLLIEHSYKPSNFPELDLEPDIVRHDGQVVEE
jgi:hypothetical protein